jgi:hypothetical protein
VAKKESKVAASPKFKPGNRITWTSQAAGSWKRKVGTVLGVVMAGRTALSKGVHPAGLKLGIAMNDRYVIAVKVVSTKGIPKLVHYTPLVKVIDGGQGARVAKTVKS